VNECGEEQERREMMAEAIRLIVTRRERGPRSPRMERALKRLVHRYIYTLSGDLQEGRENAQD
jgi:hypothetical protein